MRLLVAALAMAAATPVVAQMVMIDRPGAEARLDGRQVDLTVRFEPTGDRYKIDAAFWEALSGDKLADIALELADGQSVTYSPPGRSQLTYRFARDAEVVIVSVHRASRLRLVGG